MNQTDLNTICSPTWCPGCGNFTIWLAFKNAAIKKGWDNTNTALVAGVGCHAHFINFIKLTGMTTLHGRPLPVACGIKMANHNLNVFAFSGDGDALAEGGNHFIHTCRRNHDITLILHDNAVYGLTTGQTSPRSPYGYKSKSTPKGNFDIPLFPLTLAIASGATFVARVYSGNIGQMSEVFIKAAEHKGMSVVDVLQPCVSFNKEYSHLFYQQNVYQLGTGHDVTDKTAAFEKSLEWGEKKIPVGIFYQAESPSYESQIPQIKDQPLVNLPLSRNNLDSLFEEFL